MKLKPELQKSLDKVAKEVSKWPKWKRSINHERKCSVCGEKGCELERDLLHKSYG